MKKLGLFITALIIGTNVVADQTELMTNLTLASVETDSALNWTIEEPLATTESRTEKNLEEKTQALNDKISAQLEKTLEDKLNRELQF